MSDERHPDAGGALDDGAEDTPIAELRDFALAGNEAFVAKVERSIQRREMAAGVVDMSSRGFFQVLVEFLQMAVGVFTPAGREPRRSEGEP